jgi:hypothetical protein
MPWGRKRSGIIAPRILNLDPWWMWAASFTLCLPYPRGKSPLYTLDGGLGGHPKCQAVMLNYSNIYPAQETWYLSRYSGYATGWTIGALGFDSRRGLEIFLFTTASRTALGPTQLPIRWVPGALSLGVKRQGREADHSPQSSAEVKE